MVGTPKRSCEVQFGEQLEITGDARMLVTATSIRHAAKNALLRINKITTIFLRIARKYLQ